MRKPSLGVSLTPEPPFLAAALPLFARGQIDALEWSFDTAGPASQQPAWLRELLGFFGRNRALLGHGVFYSLLDGRWSDRQTRWLEAVKTETTRYGYHHLSEHFGFMTNADYHRGFPLPVPLNKLTLDIGIDRLKRLQDAAQLPVGVENLALAFSSQDVSEQGQFIEKLVDAVNGFLVLDLHNLYCQAHNFGVDLMALVDSYPLDAVKEIHVSGGSWQSSGSNGSRVRRDTHDGNVPTEILEILPAVMAKCQNTAFVIFEKMGSSFQRAEDATDYQRDFAALRNIVNTVFYENNPKQWGNNATADEHPREDLRLHDEQQVLVNALLHFENCEKIKKLSLDNWNVAAWNLDMVQTAIDLSKKWN